MLKYNKIIIIIVIMIIIIIIITRSFGFLKY